MKKEHIIGILERAPLAQMGEGELAIVREHAARCEECRRAYDAALVASSLLRERAAAEFEPSPFFQTRVLAALRERRAAEETPALLRLWRTTGALVSSMAATVALLAGLTFVVPSVQTPTETTGEVAAASDPFSDDAALLARDDADGEELNYDQVLTTIYESGDDAEGGNE
jgi:predicted anti-sigma-YlaC factor YlaD